MQVPPNPSGPETPLWPNHPPFPYNRNPPSQPDWLLPQHPTYTYGGFWPRFLAAVIIDPILLGIAWVTLWLGTIIVISVGPSTSARRVDWSDWVFGLVTYSFPVAYHVYGTMTGGTPGYRALGLRVTLATGGKPTLRAALIRQWSAGIGLVSQLLILLIADLTDASYSGFQLLGPFWIGALAMVASLIWFFGCFVQIDDPHRQALHDRMAGTYVIRER